MRESCNCGAFIATLSRRDVKQWRASHIHEVRPEPEPDKQGATSHVEHGGWYETDQPRVFVKTGFQAK